MRRTRVVTLNAALGPLDYRVPDGMKIEPGSVVVAPLGPRQLVGVVWEPERPPADEVGDNRLRPLVGLLAEEGEENAVLDLAAARPCAISKRGPSR